MSGNFSEVEELLSQEEGTFSVEVVTLSGVEKITVEEGTTVAEFKEENDLDGIKLVAETDGVRRILDDSQEIVAGTTIYVSTSKENG